MIQFSKQVIDRSSRQLTIHTNEENEYYADADLFNA
jgi:hypothetical protein